MNITVFAPTLIRCDGVDYWHTNGLVAFPDVSDVEVTPLGGSMTVLSGVSGHVLVSSGGIVQDFTVKPDWIPLTFIQGFAFALVVIGIPYVTIRVTMSILRQGGFSPRGD